MWQIVWNLRIQSQVGLILQLGWGVTLVDDKEIKGNSQALLHPQDIGIKPVMKTVMHIKSSVNKKIWVCYIILFNELMYTFVIIYSLSKAFFKTLLAVTKPLIPLKK